jgi:plasmid stabilization system protein ParE
MNRRIILSPDARADLRSIARWYRRQEITLSHRFKAEVNTVLYRVTRFPYASVRVDEFVRRVPMDRFSYYIYFRVTTDSVLVRRIIHQRRADTVWKERQERWEQ